MAILTEDGRIDPLKACGQILRHPGQIPHLIHILQSSNRAHRALRSSIAALAGVMQGG